MQLKPTQRARTSGFTIVELMIALLLGSLVILAVTQIYLSSAQTNRLQNEHAIMNTKSMFILEYFEKSIREAGFASCSPDFLIGNWVNGSVVTNQLLAGSGVRGYEHAGTASGDTFTLPGNRSFVNSPPAPIPGNSLAGSDVLLLQNRNTRQVTIAGQGNSVNSGNSGNSGNGQGNGTAVVCAAGVVQSGNNIQIVENIPVPQNTLVFFEKACQGGDLFAKTNQAGQGQSQGNNPTTFTKGTNLNLNSNPAGFCSSYAPGDLVNLSVIEQRAIHIAAGNNGEPALFVSTFDASGATISTEEILTGVESMQLTYGIASAGSSRSATTYVSANLVTDWSQVVSIRLSLLLRSNENVLPQASSRSWQVNDTTLQSPSDRRARMVVTATSAIRSKTL